MCLGVLLRASHRSNCYFHTRISAALASLDIVEDPLGVLLVLVCTARCIVESFQSCFELVVLRCAISHTCTHRIVQIPQAGEFDA